ncbi:hypothetical protein AOX55_0000774 [Sinorhizobium fredii CCBAU 25509]|nr:hypothetical protein AOX55_0000774 [Sinorhizobium fredii CCBAU 25509]
MLPTGNSPDTIALPSRSTTCAWLVLFGVLDITVSSKRLNPSPFKNAAGLHMNFRWNK